MPLPANHHADEGMERASRLLHDLVETAGKTMPDGALPHPLTRRYMYP